MRHVSRAALIDQPNGNKNLGRFVQHLPENRPDPVANLLRDFPTLSDAQTIQKWWTLTLARFSALNRYQGLTPEETDAQLTAMLQFEVPVGKGVSKTFGIGDYETYLKLPRARDCPGGQGGVAGVKHAIQRPVPQCVNRVFLDLFRAGGEEAARNQKTPGEGAEISRYRPEAHDRGRRLHELVRGYPDADSEHRI